MTTETTPQSREHPIPKWVGVMTAVVVFGSMAAGGGYWGWSWYAQPDPSELTEVRVATLPRALLGSRQPPTGISKISGPNGQSGYQVRASQAILTAMRPNGNDWALSFRYDRKPDLVPIEQRTAIVARARLVSDAAYAKYLNVTAEQIQQLRQVPGIASVTSGEMLVSPADEQRIRAQLDQYVSDPKAETEQPLVQALQQIAEASLPASRAAIAERTARIASILSAEQLAPFKQ